MLTTFLRNSAIMIGGFAPANHFIELQAVLGAPIELSSKLLALLALLGAGLLLNRYVATFAMWPREIFRLYAEPE